jgi:hypothetical protein
MSDSDLASQFAALSDVAARLNAKSDTLNQLIEQFQDKLRALNVGLEAWVLLQTEPGSAALPVPGPGLTTTRQPTRATPVTIEISVGHARGDDGWGLYVKRIAYKPQALNVSPPASAEVVPVSKWIKLVDASRAIRVEALGAFPTLLEAAEDRRGVSGPKDRERQEVRPLGVRHTAEASVLNVRWAWNIRGRDMASVATTSRSITGPEGGQLVYHVHFH